MNASRTLLRTSRTVRLARPARNIRQYATETSEASKGGASGAVAGGLAGAAGAAAVMYGWYHFSGAKTAVQTAKQAKSYVDETVSSLKLQIKDNVKNPQDALQVLRENAARYASFVPGGRKYVDSAFDDIDAIRKHHGEEVDKIVSEAYEDLKKVSKKGVSMEAVSDGVDVFTLHLSRLYAIAEDAAEDILDNHPDLKKKIGGSKEQVKQFAKQYGPEAKKQLEDVRDQVRGLVKNGFSWESVQKIQDLVQEKSQQAKKLGEQTLSQGGMQSFLDSNPKVKSLVEENIQVLKDGDLSAALNAVYKATTSGDTKPLEDFIKQTKEKK